MLYLGDEILPSYMGIIRVSHYKDPYEHISIYHVFCVFLVYFVWPMLVNHSQKTLDIQVILSDNDGLGRPKSQKRVLHSV